MDQEAPETISINYNRKQHPTCLNQRQGCIYSAIFHFEQAKIKAEQSKKKMAVHAAIFLKLRLCIILSFTCLHHHYRLGSVQINPPTFKSLNFIIKFFGFNNNLFYS